MKKCGGGYTYPVLSEERRQAILQLLGERGRVTAGDLSAAFGVSDDTIRRDLREMAAAGLLRKVHGGALPASAAPPTFAARQTRGQEAKAAIAAEAARLLQPGQVVVLDGGTTIVEVARRVPDGLAFTAVTNSLPVALELAPRSGVELLLVGGRVDGPGLMTVGAVTVDALRAVRADLCFLGICSLDAEAGVTTPVAEEAHVKRAMIDEAARVVALASADKLGSTAAFVVAPIETVDMVITDAAPGHFAVEAMRARGVEVRCVR